MGQAASKEAAKQAQKAVGKRTVRSFASTAGKPPRPPPLGRSHADAPDVIEDPTEMLKQRQLKEAQELQQQPGGPPTPAQGPPQMPQPDQNSGFYRGQITDPRDVAQEKFLVQRSGSPKPQANQQAPELAPDLLKFLQDVGPLEKKVNKDMTSARILKELKPGKEERKMQQLEAEANLRTRDEMRLVEDIDGYATPRTTNFFTNVIEEEEETDFGLTDLEMYDLLKRSADAKADPKVCSTYHEEKLGSNADVWTKEDKEQQQQLLNDMMKFVALPVIVKDTDMSFVGLYQEELDKEFAHQKLDVVDASRVKLVLADLHDLGRKEIKRIR